MNKLPTKQIYYLFIIIVGIIALSVYSTYALFTFENQTDDIVAIHIPKSLVISENIYEYQQITLEAETVATTDIDIHNAFDYEVCYSVWYKVIGEEISQEKVQIFEQSEGNLTSSGVLANNTHMRVKLVIVNDNDNEIKINIGTIGTKKSDGTCSLNISSDKSVVSTSYEHIDILVDNLLENKEPLTLEENYLIYTDITEPFEYTQDDKLYFSNVFTYSKELFTLIKEIDEEQEEELTEEDKMLKQKTFEEIIDENRFNSNDIYFCKSGDTCNILYRFKLEDILIKTEKTNDNRTITKYIIERHDKLIGYQSGENGLRKINDTDYIFYGDNPNNFIYYNCTNNDDLSTCELWRIVGLFYDKENEKYNTKIVRNESIGKYQYDYKYANNENQSSNDFNTSTLQKYLNEEYEIKNNNDVYLINYLQKLEIIPSLESDVEKMQTDNDNDSMIKILSLSDYIYASTCSYKKIDKYNNECFTNNWLNNIEIEREWTNTAKEVIIEEELKETPVEEEILDENQDEETDISTEPVEENKYIINYVYGIGKNITENDVNDKLDVRPVVYLKQRILLLGGDGSLEKPYIIK